MFTKEQSLTFLVALVLNQSIPSRQAWNNAVILKKRIEKSNIPYNLDSLIKLEPEDFEQLIREDSCVLHRFPRNMATYIHNMIYKLYTSYDDIYSLWMNNGEVFDEDIILKNLVSLPGIGMHKAIQGLFILSLIAPIEISDKYRLQIKAKCPDFLDNYYDDLNTILRS